MKRSLVLVPLLLLATACGNYSWTGQNSQLTEQQRAAGIKDIETLQNEYESQTYWAGLRRASDGRSNAFGRDLANMQATFNRHFLNYSADDPYVNYPSDTTSLGHLARFGTTFVGTIVR